MTVRIVCDEPGCVTVTRTTETVGWLQWPRPGRDTEHRCPEHAEQWGQR